MGVTLGKLVSQSQFPQIEYVNYIRQLKGLNMFNAGKCLAEYLEQCSIMLTTAIVGQGYYYYYYC